MRDTRSMTTYRDDRVALQNRVVKLQQELEDARRQGEAHGREDAQRRARELEDQVETLQRELARITSEVRELRGEAPRGPRKARLLAFAGLGLVVSSAVGFLVTRSNRVPRTPAPAPVMTATAVQPIETAPPPPPSTEPTEAAEKAPIEAPPPSSPRTAKPRWNASIRRAEGLALAPGAPCVIDATVEAKDTNAIVSDLVVTCGGQKLYSKRDPLNGMAQMDNDAREQLGPSDDRSTFTLQYSDVGARAASRSQIDLDSTKRMGVVFSERLPRFRVELTIPAASAPTAPLSGPEQRLRRKGRVSEVSGAAKVKPGAECVLRAMPTGQGHTCVAEVKCGAATLFPTTMGVQCTYEGARPTIVTSADEAHSLHLEGSDLEVAATGAGGFRAHIALEEP